jgi:hypothetical protein
MHLVLRDLYDEESSKLGCATEVSAPLAVGTPSELKTFWETASRGEAETCRLFRTFSLQRDARERSCHYHVKMVEPIDREVQGEKRTGPHGWTPSWSAKLAILIWCMLGVWLSLTRQGLGLGDVSIFSTLDDEVKWIDVLKMSNAARGVSRM